MTRVAPLPRHRDVSRALVAAFLVVPALAASCPSTALAHSAFLQSSPQPGARLAGSPAALTLTFTEPLNAKLTKAAVFPVTGRPSVRASVSVAGRRLVARPVRSLGRGAYRVKWHTVSTEDGHALEGSFSFGVRAPAVGGEHSIDQSPLARDGVLRVLARAVMYAALLVFAGALFLRTLLGQAHGSWLVPERWRHERTEAVARVARRERWFLTDLGFLGAAAAALSAVADASDAAGGLSIPGLRDYLLASSAGEARVVVVLLLVVAGAVAVRHPRLAVVPAAVALLALSLSGHANSASPRLPSVLVDWLHLLAASAWLGGVALVCLVWLPTLRGDRPSRPLAVARDVLPVFGRVAIPAFALTVATGAVSALVELGSISALWRTDYGRVLMLKMLLVAFIAALSYLHAFRLRPKLVTAAPGSEVSLRHWRLLAAEPLVGAAVVLAVAVLVAFPLPPRQLRADEEARAATPPCGPCPLEAPASDELAVAARAGSDLVVGWLRYRGPGLAGHVRVYGIDGKPSTDRFSVLGSGGSNCGPGCRAFTLNSAPKQLTVTVHQRGGTYQARLPARWNRNRSGWARRLLERAQGRMRALSSVRERERASSVPGLYAITDYRLKAPNRFALRTNRGVESIAIGSRQWLRPDPRSAWAARRFGGGLPFTTRSWFRWTTYARHTYLLGTSRRGGRKIAIVATMDPGTPALWRFEIEVRRHLVLRSSLVTNGHFMTQRYYGFDRPIRITPPARAAKHG